MTTDSFLWSALAPGVRAIDRRLRRRYGIVEFTDDPDCLYRVQLREAARDLPLPDGLVKEGEPVVEFHWWNEHLPNMAPDDRGLDWGSRVLRKGIHTHRLLAAELHANPGWAGVRAIGGITAMFAAVPGSRWERRLGRFGYVLLSHDKPRGTFRDYWERVWGWALWHTYQSGTLRVLRPSEISFTEAWMSSAELLRRYGEPAAVESGPDPSAPDAE